MGIIKRRFIYLIFIVLFSVIIGEFFARYYLGLGTPPLSIKHPEIEYMFKPNQNVKRFGNEIIINQYGMRTVPFPSQKENDELRIMFFGDSVLNGGNQTAHSALATTLIQEKIVEKNNERVTVGHISAGSWGPGNWLAYANTYGFFDADTTALIISSHDYADNPKYEALNENIHPTKTPVSALFEGFTKYLPRYLPQFNSDTATSRSDKFAEVANESEALEGLSDLNDFLVLAKKTSKTVLVFQHWEKEELERGTPKHGNERIREICKSLGIPIISLKPYFRESIDIGKNPYRDNIHINEIGQELIAKALYKALYKNFPEK